FSGQSLAINYSMGTGSGAVSAEHLLLVCQLAPVLDQETVAAGELVRLQRDHFLDQRPLGLVVATAKVGEDVVVVLFLRSLGALAELFDALFAPSALSLFRHCRLPPPAADAACCIHPAEYPCNGL